jgi:hypothetical protein
LVEQLTLNQRVVGSNPTAPTNICAGIIINGSGQNYCATTTGTAPNAEPTFNVSLNFPLSAPTGTYSIYEIGLQDAGGNWRYVSDVQTITKIFHDNISFQVVP